MTWQLPKDEWDEHKAQHVHQDEKLDRLCQLIEPMAEHWNNAKGFVNTVKAMGNVAKWLAAVSVALGSLWYGFNWVMHHATATSFMAVPGVIKSHYQEVWDAKRNKG